MTNRKSFVMTSAKRKRASDAQAAPPDFHGCDSRLAFSNAIGISSLPSHRIASISFFLQSQLYTFHLISLIHSKIFLLFVISFSHRPRF
jgi:hypothetical protein